MTEHFVKLYGSILDSSVWCEPAHVKLVWITMLAMADEDGYVGASVGGLARRAGVTREQAQDAIDRFLGPDPDSRDGTTGERILATDRGWEIINHRAFRDFRTREQRLKAERQARWRAKQRKEASCVDGVDGARLRKTAEVEVDTEVEAEAKPEEGATRPARAKRGPSKAQEKANRPPGISPEAWERWIDHQWARKRPTEGALAQHREKLSEMSRVRGQRAAEEFIDQCIGANAQGIAAWAFNRAMSGDQAGKGRHPTRGGSRQLLDAIERGELELDHEG